MFHHLCFDHRGVMEYTRARAILYVFYLRSHTHLRHWSSHTHTRLRHYCFRHHAHTHTRIRTRVCSSLFSKVDALFLHRQSVSRRTIFASPVCSVTFCGIKESYRFTHFVYHNYMKDSHGFKGLQQNKLARPSQSHSEPTNSKTTLSDAILH
jgi:hypothetical protein